MTLIHRSTVAMRRMWLRSRAKGKRYYTQLSPQALKISQSEQLAVARSGGSDHASAGSEGWAIPLALAVIGLAFSTFSTHQLMNCGDSTGVKALVVSSPSSIMQNSKQK